jgi:hypothetical protein
MSGPITGTGSRIPSYPQLEDDSPRADSNQPREIGKEYPTKDKDPKVPEKVVGGTRVQVPKPSKGDEDLEGGPNSKDVARRQDAARRPDDRDLDPKVIKDANRNKIEGSARNYVDGQIKKGFDEANTQKKKAEYDAHEQMIRQQGDAILGKPKPKHMPGFSK